MLLLNFIFHDSCHYKGQLSIVIQTYQFAYLFVLTNFSCSGRHGGVVISGPGSIPAGAISIYPMTLKGSQWIQKMSGWMDEFVLQSALCLCVTTLSV